MKTNISGALNVGDCVVVVAVSDDMVDQLRIGRLGRVVGLKYAGTGNGKLYPDDLLITVKFSDGIIESFWLEEIIKVKR